MLKSKLDGNEAQELHAQLKEFLLYNEYFMKYTQLYNLAVKKFNKLSEEEIRTLSTILPILKEYLTTSKAFQERSATLKEHSKLVSKIASIIQRIDEAQGLGLTCSDSYLRNQNQLNEQLNLSRSLKNSLRKFDSLIEEELRTFALVEGELIGERAPYYY